MGKGRQRRKSHHKRPSSKRRAPPRLRFLADKHLEVGISQAVRRIPGYDLRTVQELHLDQSVDWGYLKAVAVRERRIILTRDTDFLNEARFPVGIMPGILVLRLSYVLSEAIECLDAFLKSPHYARCKRATVELEPNRALVHIRRHNRVELDPIEYRRQPH